MPTSPAVVCACPPVHAVLQRKSAYGPHQSAVLPPSARCALAWCASLCPSPKAPPCRLRCSPGPFPVPPGPYLWGWAWRCPAHRRAHPTPGSSWTAPLGRAWTGLRRGGQGGVRTKSHVAVLLVAKARRASPQTRGNTAQRTQGKASSTWLPVPRWHPEVTTTLKARKCTPTKTGILPEQDYK